MEYSEINAQKWPQPVSTEHNNQHSTRTPTGLQGWEGLWAGPQIYAWLGMFSL